MESIRLATINEKSSIDTSILKLTVKHGIEPTVKGQIETNKNRFQYSAVFLLENVRIRQRNDRKIFRI